MDKDVERSFPRGFPRLVSLPFDVKVLLEAVSDADLEHRVRELAASAVVHVITPKDGNVEAVHPPRRGRGPGAAGAAQDRPRRRRGAPAFKDRFDENYGRLDEEMAVFEKAFGADVISWLDGKWPALRKAVYARKKIPQFVDDEEVGTFLYDEGLRFGTEYPITEKTLAGRVKQAQPIVDHLLRKREQDRKKITH